MRETGTNQKIFLKGKSSVPARRSAITSALIGRVKGEQTVDPELLLASAAPPAQALLLIRQADLHVDVLLERVEVEQGQRLGKRY